MDFSANTAPMGMDMAQSMLQQQRISNMRNDMVAAKSGHGLSKEAEAKVDQSAKDFEAMFMTQMLNHMFSSVKMDGPFSGGRAEEIWRSFMINEYGKSIADAGGVGIASQIKQYLISLQEG